MIKRFLVKILQVYKKTISPIIGNHCRFYPTCSEYAIDAYQNLSFFKATMLSMWRIMRCGPWAKGGVDIIKNNKEKRSI